MGDTNSMKYTISMTYRNKNYGSHISSSSVEDLINDRNWDKLKEEMEQSAHKLFGMIKEDYKMKEERCIHGEYRGLCNDCSPLDDDNFKEK